MSVVKITSAIRELLADQQGSYGILATTTSSINPGLGVQQFVDLDGVITHPGAHICIMKGTIPTESELEDAYITWNRFSGSPSDILVSSPVGNRSTYFDNHAGVVAWQGVQEGIATGTGTASWWIWHGHDSYDPQDRGAAPGAPDDTRLACIVGTITEIGGSPIGDLQLANLNIVAGQRYDFGPVSFSIAREWTW